MRQALRYNDDYDRIIDHALPTGVDCVVVKAYVMWRTRGPFVPLMTAPAFRAREGRPRMIYGADEGPMTGVGVFELMPAR